MMQHFLRNMLVVMCGFLPFISYGQEPEECWGYVKTPDMILCIQQDDSMVTNGMTDDQGSNAEIPTPLPVETEPSSPAELPASGIFQGTKDPDRSDSEE